MPTKQFRRRDSVLTILFEIPHMRTVFNVFVAILIILISNTIIQDLIRTNGHQYVFNLEILKFAFGQLNNTFHIWIIMKLCTVFLPFWGFLIWESYYQVNKSTNIINWLAISVYLIYQVGLININLYYLLKKHLGLYLNLLL